MMSNLFFFLGRLHPLLVHLPIGMLLVAFLFECLSTTHRYRKLEAAVLPSLLLGTFMALASVASGLLLSREGGYEDSLLGLHRNFGITTAVFSTILCFLREKTGSGISNKKKRKKFRILLFVPLIILLIATGHFGGSLTHGEDYLTGTDSFNSNDEAKDPSRVIRLIANTDDAVFYTDIIQPIFESRCYPCHSSTKQKGQLRLDGIDFILRGGEHGAVITEGPADSSTLYARLMLPLEDEDHMPPNEKPQPRSTEIDLIKLWISDGASFDKKVKDFPNVKKIVECVELLVESSGQHTWLPSDKGEFVNPKLIDDLKRMDVLVLPFGRDTNYLTVSFANVSSVGREHLERLIPLKKALLSLDLSFCQVNNKDIAMLTNLEQLRWLFLDNTGINDSTALEISKLSNLQYLNLVNTDITDQSLKSIASLKNLKQIYLYNTKVTDNGVKYLQRALPNLTIDTGNYTLPKLSSDTIVYRRKDS